MPAANGDRPTCDVSVTFRGVSPDRVQDLIRQLGGLSVNEGSSPQRGPNPYVVVESPRAQPAPVSERFPGLVGGPWVCHDCGQIVAPVPGERVVCRNRSCRSSEHYVAPELPAAEPSPEPPAVTWGPVCRALKKGRQSASFERCTQLRAQGEPFCARWHAGWTDRGRGCRSIDELTEVERELCTFSFA